MARLLVVMLVLAAACDDAAPQQGDDDAAVSDASVDSTGGGGDAVLQAVPGTVMFPGTKVGQSSSAQTIVIANGGNGASGVLDAVVHGPDGSMFPIGTSTCTGAPLAAGATCTVDVAFAPTVAGAISATLVVGDGATEIDVALGGTGLSNQSAALSVSPTTVDFGMVTLLTTATATATVTNVANAPTGPLSISKSGSNAADFSIVGGCTGSLAPNASCTLQLAFKPTGGGNRVAVVNVQPQSGSGAQIGLRGVGVSAQAAMITATPSTIEFGTVTVNTTATAGTLIKNTGTGASGPLSFTMSGANAGEFAVTGGCTGSLAPGGSCLLQASFTPTQTGSRNASVSVQPQSGSGAQVALHGTGTGPTTGGLSITPAMYDFGSVNLGDTSFAHAFTVYNAALAQTGPITLTKLGQNVGDFEIMGDNCSGQMLGLVGSCTFYITFEPGHTGARTASVQASAQPGGTATASLSGTCPQ